MPGYTRFRCKLDVLDALDQLLIANPNLGIEESVETLKAASKGYSASLFGDYSFVRDWVELWISNKYRSHSLGGIDPKIEFSALGTAAIEYADAYMRSLRASSSRPNIFSNSQVSSRYEFGELIGDGGMGRVFAAKDKASGDRVAIKVLLLPDPRFLEKLKSEFRTLQGIGGHPSIVPHHELFVQDNEAALVMDFVDGTDLFTAFLNAPSKRVGVGLFYKLASALNFLHSNGIVHLDIKPANVMVREDRSIALVDFGLARKWATNDSISQFAGTRRFMSPEQIHGRKISPASDLYSFGVLMFSALSNSQFSGDELFWLSQNADSVRATGIDFDCPLVRLAIQLVHDSPEARPSFEEARRILAEFGTESLNSAKVAGASPVLMPRTESQELLGFFVDDERWPKAVDIIGESGIGKSTFLHQLQRELFESWPSSPKPKFFSGSCFFREHVSYPGLDPIIDRIVNDILHERSFPRKEIDSLDLSSLSRMFPGIQRIAGLEKTPSGTSDPLSVEHAIDTLEELLEKYCSHGPVIFLIDDFQWANEGTVRILERLVESKRPMQFGLIISRRPESFELAIASRLTKLKQLHLGPFGAGECGVYLASNYEVQAGRLDELSKSLHQASRGVPVYVEELAPHFVSNQMHRFNYESMLNSKFEGLTDSQFEILSIVCCSEFPMKRDFLAELSDVSEFEESLLFLENSRLVTRSHDKHAIKPFHSIVSRHFQLFAGSDRLKIRSQKIIQHLRKYNLNNDALIGEQLERIGELESAAVFSVRAAEKMVEQFSYTQAEELYQRAIGCLTEMASQCSSKKLKWEERLASIYALNGKHELSAQLYERLAEEIGDLEKKIELQRMAVFEKQIGHQYGNPTPEADWLAKNANVRLHRNPLLLALLTLVWRGLRGLAPLLGFLFPASRLTGEQLQSIDTLAKGFVLPNPLLASYLTARLVFECKRCGDPEKLESALDVEVIFFEAVRLPWPFGMIALSEARSHKSKMADAPNPARRGLFHLSNSIREFAHGDMLASIKENEASLSNFQLAKLGSSWEIELLAGFKVYVKHWLGDFNSLNQMLTNRRHHIEMNKVEVGECSQEKFAELAKLPGFLMSAVSNSLAQDNVETAVNCVKLTKELCRSHRVSGRLHESSFCEHFVAMYCGNYEAALRNNDRQYSIINRNGYSFSAVIPIQLYLYKAAILTQLCQIRPENAKLYVSGLKKLRRKLNACRDMDFARGVLNSIDAYFFLKTDQTKEFENSVAQSISNFESVGFFCCSNFLRFHASLNSQTDLQEAWRADARKWAETNGIVCLEKFARIASIRFPTGVTKTDL